jgi:uncharacterized protein YgiM (DUF1202 family)
MGRSVGAPLLALALLAGLASGCRHAEAPIDIEPEAEAPPAPESFPLEVVVATSLNVRSGPGREHPAVGKLVGGQQVRVVGEENGWKQVRPEASGPEGWVAGEFLKSAPTP